MTTGHTGIMAEDTQGRTIMRPCHLVDRTNKGLPYSVRMKELSYKLGGRSLIVEAVEQYHVAVDIPLEKPLVEYLP